MKKCHACGQKLPVQKGDVVEGRSAFDRNKRRGIVANFSDTCIIITEFITGTIVTLNRNTCERLHGYYRITEREAL